MPRFLTVVVFKAQDLQKLHTAQTRTLYKIGEKETHLGVSFFIYKNIKASSFQDKDNNI